MLCVCVCVYTVLWPLWLCSLKGSGLHDSWGWELTQRTPSESGWEGISKCLRERRTLSTYCFTCSGWELSSISIENLRDYFNTDEALLCQQKVLAFPFISMTADFRQWHDAHKESACWNICFMGIQLQCFLVNHMTNHKCHCSRSRQYKVEV